eukprot:747574-Hanusia_phi.AAC.5
MDKETAGDPQRDFPVSEWLGDVTRNLQTSGPELATFMHRNAKGLEKGDSLIDVASDMSWGRQACSTKTTTLVRLCVKLPAWRLTQKRSASYFGTLDWYLTKNRPETMHDEMLK